MTQSIAYLDYNATAPVKPAAAAAAAEAMRSVGNPSSVHRAGRLARRAVERARDRVAGLVGASASEIVFLSGGTEANALALAATGLRRMVVSAIEHDSVLASAARRATVAGGPELVPVDGDGVVDLGALRETLARSREPALVSVMLANNETGVVQPVAEVASIAHAQGAVVHCDAVQAVGKIPVDFVSLGVDMMSVSAHKLGGPPGVGALVVREGVRFEADRPGGGQEFGRRAGTENVPGIVAFGVAAELAHDDIARAAEIAAWRDELERRVRGLAPEAGIYGAAAPRLPNTACFSMPGVASETQVIGLDLAGVAVSAGAACSSGKVRPSHVLRAMGVPEAEAGTAIRASLGWASSADDIERLIGAWTELYARAGAGGAAAESAA